MGVFSEQGEGRLSGTFLEVAPGPTGGTKEAMQALNEFRDRLRGKDKL
jgi:hypothetical protein